MTQQFKLKNTLGFNLLICKEYVILRGGGWDFLGTGTKHFGEHCSGLHSEKYCSHIT